MTPAEYCPSKVALPGSSLYYSLWSLPTGQRQALSLLPEQDRYAQRSARVQAELSEQLLVAIETDGYQLLEHHLSLTPLRKFWIAWRTLRRERRRQRHYRPAT